MPSRVAICGARPGPKPPPRKAYSRVHLRRTDLANWSMALVSGTRLRVRLTRAVVPSSGTMRTWANRLKTRVANETSLLSIWKETTSVSIGPPKPGELGTSGSSPAKHWATGEEGACFVIGPTVGGGINLAAQTALEGVQRFRTRIQGVNDGGTGVGLAFNDAQNVFEGRFGCPEAFKRSPARSFRPGCVPMSATQFFG